MNNIPTRSYHSSDESSEEEEEATSPPCQRHQNNDVDDAECGTSQGSRTLYGIDKSNILNVKRSRKK